MIKSTHKTIQDYIRPAAVPSKRELARMPAERSFEALLRDVQADSPVEPAAARTGRSIQDYMVRCLDGDSLRAGAPLRAQRHGAGAPLPPSEGNPAPRAAEPSEVPASEAEGAPPEDREVRQAIQRAAARYRIPPALIQSVIRSESNFRADAVSPAGAQGLMQLMPATARELGVSDPFDIRQNIDGGTRYLRQMLDRFEGKVEIALAAYNAGPGTVSRYGGIPPYRETQAYVRKVLASANLLEGDKIS